MSVSKIVMGKLSGALNERFVALEGRSTRRGSVPEDFAGFARIKVEDSDIYYHWQIMPEAQQGMFPLSTVPNGENAFAFTLNKVVDEIENFQVMGKKPYQVLKWSWRMHNLDRERVKHLIDQLALVQTRIRMYLIEPSEIDSFLTGWAVAAKSGYNFSCDDSVLQEELRNLDVTYALRGTEPENFTWDFVERRLTAEIRAWQRTYNIES